MTVALLLAVWVVLAVAVALVAGRHLHRSQPAPAPRHRRDGGHDPAATATSVIRRIDPAMLPTRRRETR